MSRKLQNGSIVLATVFLIGAGYFRPALSQSTSPGLPDIDRATMVILAPGGPVITDLRISVAKMAYRAWVGKYLATKLDADRNGRLNAAELTLLTDNIRQLGRISDPSEILQTAPQAPVEDVSTNQFAVWLHQRLPKAFDLIAQPQASDDAVRLASLIDADLDGRISDEELLSTFRTLRFRDLDNDETFSISELLPYRDPLSQNASVTPDVVSLPFFHITDAASLTFAAERILKRYGDTGTVDSSVFRSSGNLAVEKSRSGTSMTQKDVEAWLTSPQFHLSIEVRLSDRANTSDIDVVVEPTAAAFCTVTDDTFGQTALKVDGLRIQVVARGGGANNRALTRGFLGQTFVMVDGDRNQYLDEAEFAGILAALQQSGVNGEFSAVDQNADKMITREELFSFADRDQMASASRIEVSVKQDGKTLFALLDANQDRRLSVREVRTGKDTLRPYDLNGDGAFEETELGTEYILTFGLGQPELRRSMGSSAMMGGMSMRNGDAILPGVGNLSGPEWFRRMDRNQDGDVSRREFPGSSAHFQQVDVDGDQLISAAEAQAVSSP